MPEPTLQWSLTGDEIGPVKVVHVRDPRAGLTGFVVVDNVAAGPAIGGIRMAPDVTIGEVARLARAMTLKNAAAGLPHGGAKGGIVADPAMDLFDKERLVRLFARSIRDIAEYIPGPDMGTDERCMAWIHDETGRAVGLPRVVGGIPLDELGATGWGLAASAEAVEAAGLMRLAGARVAIQGFGAVGRHAARFLVERGARVIAVADSGGARHDTEGFDVEEVVRHKSTGASVAEMAAGHLITADELVGVDCDVWIPAARPDVIRSDNAGRLRARVVLEGANIPTTPEAEQELHARGVVVVPDFIANAGGVICAAAEHRGADETQAFSTIASKVKANTAIVLERSRAEGVTPREAALALARARVEEAEGYRRHR